MIDDVKDGKIKLEEMNKKSDLSCKLMKIMK